MKYLGDARENIDDYHDVPPPDLQDIEKIGEIFNFLVFIFSWIYFTYSYDLINPEVPIAYDEDGNALTYESKSFLFAFPGLHTVIYLIFLILGRYPQIKKNPIQEKTENKMELYLYGRKLILYIKIITSFLFTYLTFGMIAVVNGSYGPQEMYNCFAFLLLYIPGIIFYLYKCRKLE